MALKRMGIVDNYENIHIHNIYSNNDGKQSAKLTVWDVQHLLLDVGYVKVMDLDNNTGWLRVWGSFSEPPELYTLWMADVHNDANWGMSTSSAKVRKITAFD